MKTIATLLLALIVPAAMADEERVFTNEDLDRLFPVSEVERVYPTREPAPAKRSGPPARPYHRRYPLRSKDEPRYVPGELLVKFEDHVSPAERARIMARVGVAAGRQLGGGTEHMKLRPGRNTARAVKDLNQQPGVRYAEPNYIVRALDSNRSKNKPSRRGPR